MMPNGLTAIALLGGHAIVLVLIVNMTHALGWDERRTKQLKLLLLIAIAVSTSIVAWKGAFQSWPDWNGPFRLYALVCVAVALVGFPAVTIARSLRRLPEGVSGRGTEIDLAAREGRTALIGPGRHAWLIGLPGNESLRLRKLDWELKVPGLPPACDGLSLVQITDLHLARCFTRRFFEAVIDEAGAWDADLVLFTGDLIDDDACLDWIAPLLSRVKGRLGSYAILGNHDYTHHPERVRRAIRQAGFHDLEGTWAKLEIDGATVALGGTSFPWGPALGPSDMPEADFRILLSHSPDLLGTAARWGIDLMLSGHNHGGQVRLPVLGPAFMPSLYSRRYDRGFFRKGRTLLHVSQGVGGMHPVRYGCTPEVSRFVLRVAGALPKASSRAVRVAGSTR